MIDKCLRMSGGGEVAALWSSSCIWARGKTTSRIVGDRGGRIKDPLGNIWWIQTHREDVDTDTVRQRFADPAEAEIMTSRQHP